MNKPRLDLGDLTGEGGNAFVILAKARSVAKAAKLNWEEISKEATSGDYEHLLSTLEKHFNLSYKD